jgi:hypothetical protein
MGALLVVNPVAKYKVAEFIVAPAGMLDKSNSM